MGLKSTKRQILTLAVMIVILTQFLVLFVDHHLDKGFRFPYRSRTRFLPKEYNLNNVTYLQSDVTENQKSSGSDLNNISKDVKETIPRIDKPPDLRKRVSDRNELMKPFGETENLSPPDIGKVSLKTEQRCSIKALTLADHDLNLTALASPWRSGNTWVRHLLQQATGIGTSSMYCDNLLRKHGFPYECYRQKNRTIIVKTHQPGMAELKLGPWNQTAVSLNFYQAIVLIRNPYDFIVANIYDDHLGVVPEDAFFTNKKWQQEQPKYLEWWRTSTLYWLTEFQGRVLPVLYSKLLSDLDHELRKMLDFLQWDYSEKDIVCTLRNREGNFHRKARRWNRVNSVVELFPDHLQMAINNTIVEVSELLKDKYNLQWQ